MPTPLHEWSARKISEAVQTGLVSVAEVTEHYLARIDAHRDLNAFITIDLDRTRWEARRPHTSRLGGKLAGVPLVVKDCFDTAGLRTTYGSSIFTDHVPHKTALAVQRLIDAGAVVVGKANLDEFARGVSTRNPFYGWCKNPVFPAHTAGGSSGGNAAALSAGLAALGLASDAGGSIRSPCAACATAGFKPSFGLVSTAGGFPLAAPFDHVGPMARSIDDCVLAMNVLAGLTEPEPRLAGLKIGVTYPIPAPQRLEAAGAHVEETKIPSFDHLIPVHLAEFAYTHRDLFPVHREEYSEECSSMLERGFAVSAVTYRQAEERLRTWRRQCNEMLLFDLLVSPALPREPPRVDEPETFELLREMSSLTRPYNFLGWPAVVARDGVMFAGRSDETVLAAGLAWENLLTSDSPRAWTSSVAEP